MSQARREGATGCLSPASQIKNPTLNRSKIKSQEGSLVMACPFHSSKRHENASLFWFGQLTKEIL